MTSHDDLAAILDPDVFDPDRTFSNHHAAVVQVAARRHMAYEGADRVLAAGWMPADQAGVLFERVRAERDALAATIQRVEALCDEAEASDARHPWYVSTTMLRAVLDDSVTVRLTRGNHPAGDLDPDRMRRTHGGDIDGPGEEDG